MSGLEVFGAVSAAATLIDLARKCSNRLKTIDNVYRDTTAIQDRVEVLTTTIQHVSDVLRDIHRQHDKLTNAEVVIWVQMDAVLGLCHRRLIKLDTRLDSLLSKGSRARSSAVPPDIARLTEDVNTYIQALNMLKGLFQLIYQQQHTVAQRSMHRDILEIRAFQEDKMDEILRGIGQINGQQQQQLLHSRSDSVQEHEPFLDVDDKVDSLSIHLNKIVIAAADVKASFLDPQSNSIRCQDPEIVQRVPPPPSTTSDTERPPKDSLPDITHIEPLLVLAQRFKEQAEYDLEHRHYEDAQCHHLESIECFKELHDVHSVPFDTYHAMQMKLAKIYQKLEKYNDAKYIFGLAAKRPLTYACELGWKNVPLDTSQDAKHRALVSHEMAELLLEQFQVSSRSRTTEDGSNDYWVPLREAESNAKRAFRLRRDVYGKDDEYCKMSARLLVTIYNKYRDKRMYAETYEDLYLSDNEHRNTLLTISSGSTTSKSRSSVPSDQLNLADAVKDHDVRVEDVVLVMSNATLTELEEFSDGKSVMMMAMDCVSRNRCDRCNIIVDKLLRLGADRDSPFAYAVKKQRTADCRFLLEHGANIDSLDSHKLTPLMHAIKQDSLEMVSYLLNQNADINARGERGQTALHVATQRRSEKIFKMLLNEQGLDIDTRDEHGLTALHYCAKHDNVNYARWLHRAGADLEIKDRSGKDRTALWIAVKEDKYLFVKTLLKLGAEVHPEALPQPRSRDVRNLLNGHQNRNAGSTSGT